MIFFGTRGKLLPQKTKVSLGECSYCGVDEFNIVGRQIKYFHIFWIPVFAYSSQLVAACGHCKKVMFEKEFDDHTKSIAKTYGSKKAPLVYYTGLIIVLLFFGSAVFSAIIDGRQTNSYYDSPKLGDVYELKYRGQSRDDDMYEFYRVSEVMTDSIQFDINIYQAFGYSAYKKMRKKDYYLAQKTLAKSDLDSLKKGKIIYKIIRK